MSLSSVPHFFGFVNRKCNLSTVFLNGNSGCDFPARDRSHLEDTRNGAWGQNTPSMHRRCLKSLIGKSQPELPQKYERARQGGVLPSWRSRGGISFHLCNDLFFLLPGCRGNKQPNFPFFSFFVAFSRFTSQEKQPNFAFSSFSVAFLASCPP